MALKWGVVGLPNVGKSTFFNAVSSGKAESANFPFCTIVPNVGMVAVPDKRLNQLTELVRPEKEVPAYIVLQDNPGLIKGASEGEGLGNQFLAGISEVDALIHVLRCFDNDAIIHVAGRVDPCFDKEVIDYELQQADLAKLKKRKQKIEKLVKAGNKEAMQEDKLLEQFIASLAKGVSGRAVPLAAVDKAITESWHLLTCKPVIYIANIDERTLATGTNAHVQALAQGVKQENAQLVPICVELEAQIAQLPAAQQADFLAMYALEETSLHTLIRAAYSLLGLITYFTVGKDEVRAWTIPKGTLAPQAARVIHSDFEKGFIKAEVIKFADFIAYKSEEQCRQAGKIAIEGKEYVVQDGDVMHFKVRSVN